MELLSSIVRASPALRVPFLRTEQVARWLGMAPRTVCLWAACGDVPAIRVGRQWRYREADIRQWLGARKKTALSGGAQE